VLHSTVLVLLRVVLSAYYICARYNSSAFRQDPALTVKYVLYGTRVLCILFMDAGPVGELVNGEVLKIEVGEIEM
jgi:hypothetical protein